MTDVEQVPASPYSVYVLDENFERGDRVGGAYAQDAAVAIACGFYVAKQNETSEEWSIGVFDNTDTLIAFIGMT